MDPLQHIASHPLQHLDYFVEWGGKAWWHLMYHALEQFLGKELQGQHVLDIGTRYGKMSCLFALLGAKVVGIDLNRESLSLAEQEAKKWDVAERTLFVQGNGGLSGFADNSFDVVFSKSVLVVVPELHEFLLEIRAKLKPDGKIVFLENARGPSWLHLLRVFRHTKWDYTKAHYFTPQMVRVVADSFGEVVVKKTALPPVFLILGRKRD